MPLTDAAVKNARPSEKRQRMFDSGGLYLEVAPSGGKWWRLKYRYGGKEKRISLGVYPEVGLKKARKRRDAAREQLENGVDPGEARKAEKASHADVSAQSFEVIAREWLTRFSPGWSDSHEARTRRLLEQDLIPWLGSRPIEKITAPEVLKALRRMESRGATDSARRARMACGQVFRYAIATGRAERDPSIDLKGALATVKVAHHASITDPKKIGELLKAIDGYQGSFVTKCALQLAPLVFVRPGELRRAEWKEIDLEVGSWRITSEKMKMGRTHFVPLSTQAIEILRELRPLTGRGHYVFPGIRTSIRPMSENTINAALRRLGYSKEEMTGHGFRSMASTLLHEQGWRTELIERQLAHAERNAVKASYNYAEYLPERRQMMQKWADYLTALKNDDNVVLGQFRNVG